MLDLMFHFNNSGQNYGTWAKNIKRIPFIASQTFLFLIMT